ncbi:hypothetical protein EI94DRAFT_1812783 [Lactarius quietus]|nr:hypothetical protein EI94DRAFT_1812783 [Lactarius quietus]
MTPSRQQQTPQQTFSFPPPGQPLPQELLSSLPSTTQQTFSFPPPGQPLLQESLSSLPSMIQQTLSFTPPPPAQLQQPHPQDTSSTFDDWFDYHQDMGNMEVNPNFIDALGQSMGFDEDDSEYRKGLHTFPKLARGMPRSFMQSNLIQVSLLYSILKESRNLIELCRANCSLMAEVQSRLNDTFTITSEQRLNIHHVAGELMLDPNCVVYMKLHLDIEDEEYDHDNTGTGGISTPSDRNDPDKTSQSSRTMSVISHSRKHRHTEQQSPAPLHFQKGQDFWTMVDKWFFAQMHADKLGTLWTSPGWAKYIEETIKNDREEFKPVPVVNPFLDNFMDPGTYLDAVENGGGLGQPSGLAALVDHI